ncbi:MAG TPA: hypothetical protein VGE74_00775 [Gemmata sp.]
MRLLAIISLTFGTIAALTAAEPPKTPPVPTPVTFTKPGAVLGEVGTELSKQSKVPIALPPQLLKAKCGATFDKVPFWDAVQRTADAAGARVALSEGGRKVEFLPRGNSKEVATTSGAFRVVAQQVTGRALLDSGATFYDVGLLVHWEPRLRVYRIDTAPRITKVADDIGTKIAAPGGGAQVLPASATTELKVRLEGIPRKAERLTTLSGEFAVTVAEKLLTFTFAAPGGKLPEAQKQLGVSAALKRVQKKGDTWEVVVEVNYPPGQPAFESFQGEWWLRDNRLRLRSPEGKTVALDDYEIPSPDRSNPLVVIHRFKEDATAGFGNPTANGWELVYETPAPLVDTTIPFELKNVPLP